MNRRSTANLLYIAPALLLYSVIIVVPVLLSLVFSVSDWQRFQLQSVGTLVHYRRIFSDPIVGRAFANNLTYIAATIVLEGFTGLVLAALAQRMKRSMGFRAIFFAPVILPSIVIGTLWRRVYGTSGGLLNSLLEMIGIEPVVWLGPPLTMFAVSVVSGWIFAGYFMTIFYAGMSRIPANVLEAARIDGASEVTTFLRIEIPLIKNMIVLALLIIVTGGFKGFDLFQILLRRDPLQSGIVLPTYLIRTFFENANIGYGSALSMVLTLIVLGIMGIVGFINRRYVGAVDEY
jgi:raffinose/stachyose/melibiose transport system permease protein